ncbi:MAG TPA: dimethylsulfonioproprionate lyase family protein [Methylomirabilota bacterium]|jgi:hypothetical protein
MGGSITHPDRAARAAALTRFLHALHSALADAATNAVAPNAAGALSLVAELDAFSLALAWTQNPNYRRRPPDPSFLDNYGYAVIAGPADGPPALAVHPHLALGVLLLGPHAHYPIHAHPATEVYYTLTPGGEWWRDDGPWRAEPAGTAIHHPPNVRHATRAGASPLLAVYLWSGDLATHARLADPDMTLPDLI